MKSFNKIFSKGVAYNNIKSHKQPGLHSPSRRYIFGKTTGRSIDFPQPFKG